MKRKEKNIWFLGFTAVFAALVAFVFSLLGTAAVAGYGITKAVRT